MPLATCNMRAVCNAHDTATKRRLAACSMPATDNNRRAAENPTGCNSPRHARTFHAARGWQEGGMTTKGQRQQYTFSEIVDEEDSELLENYLTDVS